MMMAAEKKRLVGTFYANDGSIVDQFTVIKQEEGEEVGG
jgi:hypothetical protein